MARTPIDPRSELRQKIRRDHQANTRLTDAILHPAEGSELCYNVIYRGDAAGASILDLSGSGIDSPEALTRVLGTADAPAEVLSTHPGTSTMGKAVTADLTTDHEGNIITLTVKAVHPRPIIGISWKKDKIAPEYLKFAEALERNGALAVFLPQITDEAGAREILGRVDGLFVTGGGDFHPKYFGQEPTPHGAVNWDEARDISDLILLRQAIALDIPMLAVCRGTQGLNVALGGGLIQDVPSHLGAKVLAGTLPESRVTTVLSGTLPSGKSGPSCGCERENHLRVIVDRMDHGVSRFYHELTAGIDGIGIAPDSKWLRPLYGADFIELISTSHHQAIDPDALGRGLTIAASTSDGIVEAVEYRDNLFVLALQWHPERDALFNARSEEISQDSCNAPLRELVKFAVIHAARKK